MVDSAQELLPHARSEVLMVVGHVASNGLEEPAVQGKHGEAMDERLVGGRHHLPPSATAPTAPGSGSR